MNAFLNYLVEANLGLCLMLVMYVIFLRDETDFAVKRMFLLASIGASILFPLVQIDGTGYAYVPSLMQILPTTWLPEVVVIGEGQSSTQTRLNFDSWLMFDVIYTLGLVATLTLFIVRLFMVARTLWGLRSYRLDDHVIYESDDNRSSFSFFRCIYIGQASQLSVDEKAMVIHHEQIHARRLHSFDILLINVVGVFFWFNPVIRLYKKIFIQLHEFEADARSVSTRDVDNYCSLLAKVALLSADIRLANHFSNSLTIKRIEMMRTIKAKIKRWKYVALSAILPCFFFVVACQEQVVNEMTEVAKNANNALLVPANVQARYDELKKANPNSKILLLDLNEEAITRLQELEKQYGNPNFVEFFKPDGQTQRAKYTTTLVVVAGGLQTRPATTNDSHTTNDGHTYAILEYNETVSEVIERAKSSDLVYPMVDEPAQFPGGIEGLVKFLSTNIHYPKEAREAGMEGTVYITFVVEKDGTITSAEPVKGLSPVLNAEATRVVEAFPKWTPGKKDGEVVRTAFVVPIKFKLGG
ncbi:MAG TPA: M56 family metallopeptidase [Chryseolinea sp.]|nr:M56 family metallopeptidase [Chryseolinea sp.]